MNEFCAWKIRLFINFSISANESCIFLWPRQHIAGVPIKLILHFILDILIEIYDFQFWTENLFSLFRFNVNQTPLWHLTGNIFCLSLAFQNYQTFNTSPVFPVTSIAFFPIGSINSVRVFSVAFALFFFLLFYYAFVQTVYTQIIFYVFSIFSFQSIIFQYFYVPSDNKFHLVFVASFRVIWEWKRSFFCLSVS